MLKSSLCDSDAYVLVKGTITVNNTAAADAKANNTNKKDVMFENFSPFTDCESEINNVEIDNAKDTDIVMPMYNLIKYIHNYSKTYGRLWRYFKGIPAVNNNAEIVDFALDNLND